VENLKAPDIELIAADVGATIPELRAMAFAVARAEVVAVIEDHVIVPRGWARSMLAAHAAGAEVVGGSVENAATERLVDKAAFLCEYSHCLVPPSGPSDWVVGNNVTYRRSLLERFKTVIDEHMWENHLHDALKGAGVTLVSDPAIRVGHKKHYTVAEYSHQRYLYSRSFAGMRVSGVGAARKLAYGFAAFLLPPILLFRLFSRVWTTGKHRNSLVASLPLQAVFVSSWAAGEIVGYWFGPGDSLRKVC
jgi:hypothetical protein